jgi:glycosyltransferase involved in cell wall biosynthesis
VKILEVTTDSSAQYQFVLPIAEHLRAQGHEVIMACSADPGAFGRTYFDELRAHGFEVVVIPMARNIRPRADLVSVLRLRRYIRSQGFDLVRSQNAKAGLIGRAAARLAGVPVVLYTAHAFPFHAQLPGWKQQVYASIERAGARLCDAIIVDSQAVRQRGLDFKVAPPEKIRVVNMGVDPDRYDPARFAPERAAIRAEFGLAPDSPVVGAVARLVPDKGVEHLVDAMAQVVARCANAQCLIVGDGPLRPALTAQVNRLGLRRRILFTGHLTEALRAFAALDLFVLPTYREGFGVVFAEAMSMEVPVIASRIAPVTEVVADGETGLLIELGNVAGFAEAILALLEDEARRKAMGRAGRQRVIDLFSHRRMAEAHEKIYLEQWGAKRGR